MFNPIFYLFFPLLLLITSCSGQVDSKSAESKSSEEISSVEEFFQNQPKSTKPAKIAIGIDFSGSRETSRIEKITLEDFTPLINTVSDRGGEIGVVGICSDSNLSALRIRVESPPSLEFKNHTPLLKPIPPDTEKISPFKAKKLQQQYQQEQLQYQQFETEAQKRIALHQQDLERWENSKDQDLDKFKSKFKNLLEQPATCQNTDIWGAIARIDLFLHEDSSTWNLPPKNFAVLITDGEHNTEREPVQMQSQTEILLVNGAAKGGELKELDYKAFEAPSAAFQYLVNTLNREEVVYDK